ncbi:MAG: Biotin/lipoyl attachment protein [Pseudomonadota bacterium]|jgi:acetyl-CoA carboxylase biotin carboxyl carrier protein
MLKIKSEVTGTVWKVLVSPGQSVEADEVLAIVESMKMEIPIAAERAGQVSEVLVAEGDPVAEDQVVIHLV